MDLIKFIAFYLPQFHSIPENDKWWGEGFTEWTNVKKAKPLFEGHIQPHTPTGELGYYDLTDIKVIEKQAKLAKEHGVHGFCFYYYWFGGKKLLDTPLNLMLNTKKPDIPFCLCWANENWTRRWDGREDEVLISQNHSDADDKAFIEDLINVFKDERYIKIDDKPLLLIYRTSLFPDIKRSAKIWRRVAKNAGFEDLYLARVEGLEESINPESIGFDAGVEFAPDWRAKGRAINEQKEIYGSFIDNKIFKEKCPTLYDYNLTMNQMINRPEVDYKYFRGAFPAWDNTPRRGNKGTVFWGAEPESFKYYLSRQIENTRNNKLLSDEEKIIFINAWNEWGEGCYLEPDEEHRGKNLLAVKESMLPIDASKQAVYASLKQLDGLARRGEEEREKIRNNLEEMKELQLASLDEVSFAKDRIKVLENEIHSILNSKSWRVTKPIRKLSRRINKKTT